MPPSDAAQMAPPQHFESFPNVVTTVAPFFSVKPSTTFPATAE